MHLVEINIVECRPLSGALPLSQQFTEGGLCNTYTLYVNINMTLARRLAHSRARGVLQLPNGVRTNGVFAEGPQILYILSCICLSAHMMPHHAIFCHMLSTFSRDNSLWGIAALLRRPRLSLTPSGSCQSWKAIVTDHARSAPARSFVCIVIIILYCNVCL